MQMPMPIRFNFHKTGMWLTWLTVLPTVMTCSTLAKGDEGSKSEPQAGGVSAAARGKVEAIVERYEMTYFI